jgi:hypothetical protein
LTVAWQLHAAAAALIIPPAIRLMSLAKLMTWLTRKRVRAVPLDDKALARWVTRILSRLPQPWHLSCLNRSVVLYHLLRRAGRPVELCIGVHRATGHGGRISAHAWLVLDGAPYLESDVELVTSLPIVARFPSPDAPSLAPTT